MQGEGQSLAVHLNTTLTECKRLRVAYCHAVEKLETYTLPNLLPHSAAQWFKMYLRVVDIGIQIRRGEIRHRTNRRFTYPCMHKSGIKGAIHSGLSIDDANAIYKLMEDRKLVKESQLDGWFMKIDGLDQDDIGLLDKRVTGCLDEFRKCHSGLYERIEVTGKDPHEELLVLGESGTSGSRVMMKVTRTCFGPTTCSCEEDAQPWERFSLVSDDPHAQDLPSTKLGINVRLKQGDEVGINDIKRRLGFKQLSLEEQHQDAASLARDATELTQIQRTYSQHNVAIGLRTPATARSIYHEKCKEIGSNPKPSIDVLLTVKSGAHFLNLSGIGFHLADDLMDLVDIFTSSGLPLVKELDLSNSFFNARAFQVLLRLLQIPVLRQTVERLSLRCIAVPQPGDVAVLLRLLTGGSCFTGSLKPLHSLKTLDLSFNTLWGEGVACLRPLLGSLRKLENLSLESCFPKPTLLSSVSTICLCDEKATENVRVILTEVCSQLQCLDFGSNCIVNGSCWLDAIFTSGNALQKVALQGVMSFNSITETTEVESQAEEIWDLHQVQTLVWSSSTDVYTNKFWYSLSAVLRSGFAQLKHLDIRLHAASGHDAANRAADTKVADIIMRVADYAVLKSCHICCYSSNETMSHDVNASITKLLEHGLHECEVLTLQLPQLYLDPSTICDLLSCAFAPVMQKMTLAVGVASEGNKEPAFASCFLQMQSIEEITLELHAIVESQSEAKSIALARKLEASWLCLSSASSSISYGKKRPYDHRNRNGNRSYALFEQRKATKHIYRCRFLAASMPR